MKNWQDGQNSITTNFARRSWLFYKEIDWYDRQDAFTKIWHDGQDSWSKIWDEGQESFATYLARWARFFYDKNGVTGKILQHKLARRARFFYKKKFARRARFFTTLYPIYPVPFLGVKTFLTRPDQTIPDAFFIKNWRDGQDFLRRCTQFTLYPFWVWTLFEKRPDQTRPYQTRRDAIQGPRCGPCSSGGHQISRLLWRVAQRKIWLE